MAKVVHPLHALQQYCFEHICTDPEEFTADLIRPVLASSLVPISLAPYPETFLPPPPDEDPLPLLFDDWGRKGLLAKDGVFYEETLEHDDEVMAWMRQAKRASVEAGRRFARAKLLSERGPFVPAVPRPLSPILSRKAMRETPRITDPTFVDPLVPRSLKALMDWDIFEPIPCDEFSEELENPVTEDDALDLRPSLTEDELKQVKALFLSVPRPMKKEKTKNAIIVTAEERGKSNALVLHPSWGRKSREVRRETQERVRSISPPMFPRRLDSSYYELTGRSTKADTGNSTSTARARPLSSAMSSLPTRTSELIPALAAAPAYDLNTGIIIDKADEEFDELEDDPFSMYELNTALNMPQLPPDIHLTPSPPPSGVDADLFDPRFFFETDLSATPEMDASDDDSDMADLDVPEVARARTLEAHREDEDAALPATLAEAIDKVLGPSDEHVDEQAEDGPGPGPRDNLSRLIITNIDDPDDDEDGPVVSPSLVVERSSRAVDANANANAHSGDLVVQALAMLPGGEDEIGRSAASWVEREQWDNDDDDYWEVPDLPAGRTYFTPHPATTLTNMREILRAPGEVDERESRLRLTPTMDNGLDSLSAEVGKDGGWRPIKRTFPQDEVLPDDSVAGGDGPDEAAAVDRLFADHADLVSQPSSSTLFDLLSPLTSTVDPRARRFEAEDDDIIYTRQESVIRREQHDKGGKRPLSHVDADETETETEVAVDASVTQQAAVVTPTRSTDYQYPRSPPRISRRLSAIEEEDEDGEMVPMEGTNSGLFSSSKPSSPAVSPSPPTSNGRPWKRRRPTTTIVEHPEETAEDPHPYVTDENARPAPTGSSIVEDTSFEQDSTFQQSVDHDGSSQTGLAHFLSSRGKGPLPDSAHPSAAVTSPPRQHQVDQAVAEQDDFEQPEVVVEDKSPLPTNLAEFDSAWLSGGVAPGEHGGKSPPVLHVVAGQRLLQNRAALKSLVASRVQPHERPLSNVLASNPHIGLDVLVSPLAAVIFTPLRTLPALAQDLLGFLPSVRHKLDRLFVVLVLPEKDGVDVWTNSVRQTVGKLRRGIAMMDWQGGGEDDGAEAVTVKVGWAGESQVGRLTRGLVLSEVDAGSCRGGEESWTGSWLNQKEDAEDEAASDDWEEEENELAINEDLNPYSAALILSSLSADEFLELTDVQRLDMFASLLGQARVTRLNAHLAHRLEQLLLSSSPAPETMLSSADDGRMVSYSDDNDMNRVVGEEEEQWLAEKAGRQEDDDFGLGPGWSESEEFDEMALRRGGVQWEGQVQVGTVYD